MCQLLGAESRQILQRLVLHDFDPHEEKAKVNWVEYYFKTYENLTYLKRMKVNVAPEFREFYEVLSKEPTVLQQQVNSKIRSFRFITKEFFYSEHNWFCRIRFDGIIA